MLATASLLRVCASVLTAPSIPALLQTLEGVLADNDSPPGLVQAGIHVVLQMSMIGARPLPRSGSLPCRSRRRKQLAGTHRCPAHQVAARLS